MNSPELKNVGRELLRFRRRLLLAVGGVVLAFGLLIGRWLWLQVLRHRQYSLQARDNRVAIVPVQPSRGLIVDRNGIVLADNFAAYTLEITPSKTVGLAATISALRAVVPISPHDERRFHALLAQNRSFESIPIRSRLSDAEVARFVAQRFRFPGVEVHARLFRSYPLGSLGCHVIGMVGRINANEQQQLQDSDQAANYQGADHIGKTGVELGWERQLHGTIGFDEVEVNVAGKPVRKLRSKPPVPGSTLVLSLDARMQKLAEDLYGDRSGACVAMDPRSGEVLVMASMPTFDPNLFVEGIDPQNWNQLNTDPRRPLLDRVLRGTFPPGSTYKPYLAMGALTQGLRTASYVLNDPGFFMLGHHKFRDDVPGGHGKVDMHKAIEVSCDTYFYMVANDWGVDGMHDWTRHFGFGRLSGVDLPGEVRGILPSKAWKKRAFKTPALQRWYAGETISLGIGQGYNSFTPMQLANALATMANGGTRFKPRVVRMVEDMDTHRFVATPAEVAERLHLDPGYWQVVHDGMVAVNAGKQGTAYAVFKDAPYTSAGKTGTAQVFTVGQHQHYDAADLARHLLDHALYTVWAPADNPTICVALIVEHAGWGASAAAPIARKLIDYHLLGTLPSDDEIQKISGRKPTPLPFRYAGARDGLPPVPGAHAPPPHPGASSAAEASSAAAPPVQPWPAPSPASAPAAPRAGSTDARSAAMGALQREGRYVPARCGTAPLFSRFGAAPECPDPDQGERL